MSKLLKKLCALILAVLIAFPIYSVKFMAAEVPEEYYEMSTVTNIVPSAYNRVLYGTMLSGYGDIIYRYEHEYSVNGLLILSFMRGETSFGGGYNGIPINPNAYYKNNFFGIMNQIDYNTYETKTFSSPESSIRYFCRLMNSEYYKNKPLSQICSRYCPEYGYFEYIKKCIQVNYDIIADENTATEILKPYKSPESYTDPETKTDPIPETAPETDPISETEPVIESNLKFEIYLDLRKNSEEKIKIVAKSE